MLNKSVLTNYNNDFVIHVEMDSVDTDNRLVGGWATLNNLDYANHIVDLQASINAFGLFRGNIREMHKDQPCGVLKSYTPSSFYDEKTGKTYQGIYVVVYISEGAENAWKMVLDGTYNGFSIGAVNAVIETAYSPEYGRDVNTITSYFLKELSIVDSPANKLSNFDVVVKSIEGVDNDENVSFMCHVDKTLVSEETPGNSCPKCGNILEKVLNKGDNMADSKLDTTKVTKSAEATPVDDAATEEAVLEDGNKGPEEIDDPFEAFKTEVLSTVNALVQTVNEKLTAPVAVEEKAEVSKSVENSDEEESFEKKLTERIDTMENTFATKLAEISKSIEDSMKNENEQFVKSITSQVDEIKKSLDKVDSSFATQKSIDESNKKQETKSFWDLG